MLDRPRVAHSAQQCVSICLATENCNAMTWRGTGVYGQLPHCYPKNVPADFETIDRLYYSTYRMCDEEVATSTEQPAAAGTTHSRPQQAWRSQPQFSNRSQEYSQVSFYRTLPFPRSQLIEVQDCSACIMLSLQSHLDTEVSPDRSSLHGH